jgi:hypothetical protein
VLAHRRPSAPARKLVARELGVMPEADGLAELVVREGEAAAEEALACFGHRIALRTLSA